VKRFRWFAALLAVAAMALVARCIAAADAPASAILYPTDGCTIKGNLAQIMAIAPASDAKVAITLDGKPLEIERMAFAPTWAFRDSRLYATSRPVEPPFAPLLKDKSGKVLLLAVTKLSPGKHVLALGDSQIHIIGSDSSELPKGATIFHEHQPAEDAAEALACDKCHAMTGEAPSRVLGIVRVPAACESCHDEVNVQLAHRHVLDNMKKCTSCHDPHGTTREKLLIAPQEKLCTQCHEGGHSKR